MTHISLGRYQFCHTTNISGGYIPEPLNYYRRHGEISAMQKMHHSLMKRSLRFTKNIDDPVLLQKGLCKNLSQVLSQSIEKIKIELLLQILFALPFMPFWSHSMNILIIRFSALGDLVTQEVAFRAVRHFYPHAHITFLTSPIEKHYTRTAPTLMSMLYSRKNI